MTSPCREQFRCAGHSRVARCSEDIKNFRGRNLFSRIGFVRDWTWFSVTRAQASRDVCAASLRGHFDDNAYGDMRDAMENREFPPDGEEEEEPEEEGEDESSAGRRQFPHRHATMVVTGPQRYIIIYNSAA